MHDSWQQGPHQTIHVKLDQSAHKDVPLW
jgi:hypothetical protein